MPMIGYLTKIQFDHGALALLPEELELLGASKPLVVTDPGIVASGLLDQLLGALGDLPHAVFDETLSNPTEEGVLAALAIYKEQGCDSVVGFGGGSSIDLGKAVRLLSTHAPPLVSYAMAEGGVERITADMPPLVAIPTTAGTGSEVGRGSVVVMADGRKLGLISPHLMPSVAICDPDLTLGLPPSLTAATGLDAMSHCMETYLSPAVNPPADAIALDGLRRAAAHIETATNDGSNKEARWNMMMAAMEGAMAFQKGLGAVHAMSHPLGALEELRLHHGTLNAVVTPAVLEFNKDSVGDKYAVLADAMGLPPGADLIEAVADLNERLGMPASLAEMGVKPEWFRELSEQAVGDHCNGTNPREAGVEDYIALFEAASKPYVKAGAAAAAASARL